MIKYLPYTMLLSLLELGEMPSEHHALNRVKELRAQGFVFGGIEVSCCRSWSYVRCVLHFFNGAVGTIRRQTVEFEGTGVVYEHLADPDKFNGARPKPKSESTTLKVKRLLASN